MKPDKDEQKILFTYIDNCYVSTQEKQEMKKAMKNIWKKYPDNLTEEDNEILEEIDIATSE